MRQLGEELAKTIASRVGVNSGKDIKQSELLIALNYQLKLDKQVKDAFHTLRKLGNNAAHDITSSSHRDALIVTTKLHLMLTQEYR
jgi:type I restriction enzyme R subunit